jgi:transcriptional regulator with XRE-family HTH domain
MTGEYAAGLLGVDRGKISNIESGTRAISPERLRTLACNCDCDDEAYIDALVEMAQPAERGWWERYRGSLPAGLLDIAELEHHAVRIRSVHLVHMPGLLQSSDHAQAVFKAALPPLPEHEIALRLAHRLERQRVLEGDAPTEYVGIVHEAALRMQFGGRKVARGQLEHLLAMSQRAHVTLRAIPFDAGSFPGAGQTVVYLEGPVPQLDTIQIDSAHGPEFLYQKAQLSKYRTQLDWMEERALSPEASYTFIQAIASQL